MGSPQRSRHYEGHRATPELPTSVYRIDAATGQATVVTGDVERPNGLCFSPDESRLYVVASGVRPREVYACYVNAQGAPGG